MLQCTKGKFENFRLIRGGIYHPSVYISVGIVKELEDRINMSIQEELEDIWIYLQKARFLPN